MTEPTTLSHNPSSIEEVQAQLATVAGALSWPLSKVLVHFKPNDYLREQLESDLPAWGDQPLHRYLADMQYRFDGPDILNMQKGNMEPVNIFYVLAGFYNF